MGFTTPCFIRKKYGETSEEVRATGIYLNSQWLRCMEHSYQRLHLFILWR